ncbi:MAG: hypothetical protein AB1664_12635 [Thermodesulfobacteriota bacterium]
MKDDDKIKETGAESSEEPMEESKQLDRGTFLKALGVGIGAVGLDLVTGGHLVARAAAELDGSRSAIQKLVRGLLESPSKAKDFLENPQEVAAELGVRLSESDAKTIKESLIKLAKDADAAQLMPGHQDWVHQDGTWHDSYNKTVTPRTGTKTTKPPTAKPPTGTRRQ